MTDMTFAIHRDDDKREVVAIMPGLAGLVGRPDTCTCYVSVGGHSSASIAGVLATHVSVSPEEYADLYYDLVRLGYVITPIPLDTIDGDDYLAERLEQLG